MSTNVIIQARMGGSRLKGKIMMELAGKPMLWHVIQRARVVEADNVIVACPDTKENHVIAANVLEWFKDVIVFLGDEQNVWKRYNDCLYTYSCDKFVRITADNPLFDIRYLNHFLGNGLEYDYIEGEGGTGQRWEIVKSHCIYNYHPATDYEKEHVTQHIINDSRFIKRFVKLSNYGKLSVDNFADYQHMQYIYKKYYKGGVLNAEKIFKMSAL